MHGDTPWLDQWMLASWRQPRRGEKKVEITTVGNPPFAGGEPATVPRPVPRAADTNKLDAKTEESRPAFQRAPGTNPLRARDDRGGVWSRGVTYGSRREDPCK